MASEYGSDWLGVRGWVIGNRAGAWVMGNG